MADKIIGILGGVGPWATVDMFKKFLETVSAERDQDYPRLIIYCNSKIPDRNKAIMERGADPVPALQDTARSLEKAGAAFIVIGSNGTHYYHDAIQKAVEIPVLNMIEETVKFIKDQHGSASKIGLVAATCTILEQIYERHFKNSAQVLLTPRHELQEKVMGAIYEVKVGQIKKPKETLVTVATELIQAGAGAIICGCTEVSVGLQQSDLDVPVIDPMKIIAKTAIRMAL